MTKFLGMLLVVFVGVSMATAADEKSDIKEIELNGVKDLNVKGKPTAPTTISSADELAKAFTDATFVAKLKNEVDFTKNDLVYFGWSGSGQDKLSLKASADGKEVHYTYQAGRTRDLRPHAHLYVIAKGAKLTTTK